MKMKKCKSIKRLLYLLCFILLISGCGCSNDEENDDKTFYLDIKNDTEVTIYGFHYEYLLNGEAIGGGVISNADGSVMEKGEISTKEFHISDFPENADIAQFQIYFYVIYKDQSEDEVKNLVKINAQYKKHYTIIISGEGKDHFYAQYQ